MDVPVVDLSQPETEAAGLLRQACVDHGFFYSKESSIRACIIRALKCATCLTEELGYAYFTIVHQYQSYQTRSKPPRRPRGRYC